MSRRFMKSLMAVVLVGTFAPLAAPAHAAGPGFASPTTIHSGSTAADAAPSCWSIKQSFPASADGIYWLLTPALVFPQQFYCDMTTDGGGYVLVGRGRENWTYQWRGQGTAANVRTIPTGTAAFPPAALPTTVVDGLLNKGRVDALPDGVRVRRAKDIGGSQYQEVRYKYLNLGGWSWDLNGGIPLSSISFDGSSTSFSSYSRCNSATTCDVNFDSFYRRIWTKDTQHSNKLGFSYGSSIDGQNNANSYLWVQGGEHNAIAFSQVFIRPMLGDSDVDFGTIPDSGTVATALRPLPSSTPQIFQWGVTDVAKPATDPDQQNDSPVLALAQVGNTMFVGGKFQNVQNGAGGPKTSQPWLAAFDVQTGAWISSWRPVLDGAVWDMRAAPDGTLLVGGNFTSINGAPNTAGLAKLDPVTAQVVPGWSASIANPRFLGSRANVRALDIHGNWLYVAGSFGQISGGPSNISRNTGGVARVSLTDGTPDTTWRAFFDNTIMDISASPDGTRVYVVGFFKNTGITSAYGSFTDAVAVLDSTTGAVVPGMQPAVPSTSNATRHWQQTIMEYQGAVFQGGSEHMFHKVNRSDYSLVRGHITDHGGDFQATAAANGVIFGSCHCYQSAYSDAYSYPPTTGYGRVDNIQWLGAWDANTFDKINEWDPQWGMNTGTGEGPWEITFDSFGCMWAGGDIIRGGYTGTTPNWLGGFARFCPRDTSPPTTPTSLQTTVTGGVTSLHWNASTDDSGTPGITYEILRDDRVIATQTSRTFALTDLNYGRYFVRAKDAGGNRGASTPVLVVGTAPTYPQVVTTTPNVAAYWRLGDANTASPAADAVGGNSGVYSGGVATGASPVVMNTVDQAASFDGTNGAVTIADAPGVSPTTGASVEAWVDFSDTSGGRRDVVSKSGSYDLRLNALGEGSTLAFSVTTNGGTFTATTSTPAPAGRHHLVGTYDGVTVKLYDNGALAASATGGGAILDTANPVVIGNGSNGPMFGRIDDVSLYGRGLSLKEVSNHYASGGKNIIPNQPPTAAFQATCGELSCGLNGGSSADPDGTITSYVWQINDGGTTTGVNAVHTFATAGTYSVTLTVTDNVGATSTTTQSVIVAPSVPAPYAQDAFGRTVVNNWGTADVGGAWTISGTATNYAVNNNVATIVSPTASASNATRLLGVSDTDFDVQARFQYNTVQSGGSWVNLVGRYVGSGLEYRGRVRLGSTNLFAAAYRVAGGLTQAIVPEVTVPGIAANPNTWYRARMNVSGTNPTVIKLKVWLDGTPEPAAWNVTASDATAALQVPGSPGIQTFANGSSSYPLTISVDDFLVNPANTPPVASFSTNCNLPLACATNASASTDEGSIAGYQWSFGDGSSSSGVTATHTYAQAGTYVVTLMVTDNGGFTSAASHTVVVEIPPNAAFTVSCVGNGCNFDAAASQDPDGSIASYAWDFGDGQTATGLTTSHTYASAGSRTVTLVVTDNQAETGTTTHLAVADVAPVAAFVSNCATTTSCTFDATTSSDSDGSIASFSWDFGDGTTGSGVSPGHVYASGGTHLVVLTVTDNLGQTGSVSHSVVLPAAPVALFTSSCVGDACSFDASTSFDPDGNIVSYAWDFGDGQTAAGLTTPHTYASPGAYTVTLTVVDNSTLSSFTSHVVTADIAPSASFTLSCAVLTCTVDASASTDSDGSISSYAWNFGDGTVATGATSSHTYALAGNWPVTLTVTDNLSVATITAQAAFVAPVPAPNQFAIDAFGRTVANGWGTADQGGAWTTSGTPSSFVVNGGVGTFSLGASGASAAARLLSTTQSDVDLQTKVSYNVAQSGNGSWINLIGRYVAANSEYRARIRFSATSVFAQAYRLPGGAAVAVGAEVAIPGLVSSPGTVYRARFNLSGTNPTTMRIKVWVDGTPEPSAWNVNVTDSTAALQTAGAAGVQAFASSSSTYPLAFSFDDLALRPANLPPISAFTATCSGSLGCTVDAGASTDDGAIASYSWVFGDGTTATGVTAAHTYGLAGSYTITLTVTDNQGVVTTTSQVVNVT